MSSSLFIKQTNADLLGEKRKLFKRQTENVFPLTLPVRFLYLSVAAGLRWSVLPYLSHRRLQRSAGHTWHLPEARAHSSSRLSQRQGHFSPQCQSWSSEQHVGLEDGEVEPFCSLQRVEFPSPSRLCTGSARLLRALLLRVE